jgi:hypothetical protein
MIVCRIAMTDKRPGAFCCGDILNYVSLKQNQVET